MFFGIVLPLIFVTSCVYATLGLGGGTAYLAILTLWEVDPEILRPIAWTLNVICATAGFWQYYRQGFFRLRPSLKIVGTGIIGAILGANVLLPIFTFQILLGIALLSAVYIMARYDNLGLDNQQTIFIPLWGPPLLGLVVGFFAGLIGFGGGILISPFLVSLRWMKIKEAAATSSFFIILTSSAALLTYLVGGGSVRLMETAALGGTVLVGAFLGGLYGATKASSKTLKTILIVIVLLAAVKVLVFIET